MRNECANQTGERWLLPQDRSVSEGVKIMWTLSRRFIWRLWQKPDWSRAAVSAGSERVDSATCPRPERNTILQGAPPKKISKKKKDLMMGLFFLLTGSVSAVFRWGLGLLPSAERSGREGY